VVSFVVITALSALIVKVLPKVSFPQTHPLAATDGDGALIAVSILGEQDP
jgi:hypothetical protein